MFFVFGKCPFLLRWKNVLTGSHAYPEQVRYSYGDIRTSTVCYPVHIRLTYVFPVTCPVLVRSLLNFQAPHPDRKNFEWQRR